MQIQEILFYNIILDLIIASLFEKIIIRGASHSEIYCAILVRVKFCKDLFDKQCSLKDDNDNHESLFNLFVVSFTAANMCANQPQPSFPITPFLGTEQMSTSPSFCPAPESLVTFFYSLINENDILRKHFVLHQSHQSPSFINEENMPRIIGIAMFTLLRVPSGLSSINASYLINIIMSERLENVMSRYMYLMNILQKKQLIQKQ